MRILKAVCLLYFSAAACSAQIADVEKATLKYDLNMPTAPVVANAPVDKTGETTGQKHADLVDLILEKAGKKEKKVIEKILQTGEQTGLLTREKITRQLGNINVSAVAGLYESLRSLKLSGFNLKRIENIRETLMQIETQLKQTGIKTRDFGNLSFMAGLAKERLGTHAADDTEKETLRQSAQAHYQNTIVSLAAEKDVVSTDRVEDAKERSAVLTETFGRIIPVAPAKGKSVAVITSDYGPRIHPVKKTKRFHSGIDLAGWKCDGWRVSAIGPGRVVKSAWETGYGYSVIVSHEIENKTLFSRYAHLKKSGRAKTGTIVKPGDLLGYCNNSGISTGAHLHFEIRDSAITGKTLDPKAFIPKVEMLK